MGDDIALTGGIEIEVRTKKGNSEKVKVLQLAIEHMLPLAQAGDDEIKQVLLYSGKDESWVKSLDGASQVAILEKGEEVNGDFFRKWSERRMKKALQAKKQIAELQGESVPATSPSGPPRPQ
jgi:hypothetical protein